MPTKNWEVFAKDPRSSTIPNLGVAEVGLPTTDKEWAVLRYELSTFVCEGEYERGLERILDTYLANLDKPSNPRSGSAASTAAASPTWCACSSTSGATDLSRRRDARAASSPCRTSPRALANSTPGHGSAASGPRPAPWAPAGDSVASRS